MAGAGRFRAGRHRRRHRHRPAPGARRAGQATARRPHRAAAGLGRGPAHRHPAGRACADRTACRGRRAAARRRPAVVGGLAGCLLPTRRGRAAPAVGRRPGDRARPACRRRLRRQDDLHRRAGSGAAGACAERTGQGAMDARAGVAVRLSPPAVQPPAARAARGRQAGRLVACLCQQPHPVHQRRRAGLDAALHRPDRRRRRGPRCAAALPRAGQARGVRPGAPAGAHRPVARAGCRTQRAGHRKRDRRMRAPGRRRPAALPPRACRRSAPGAGARARRRSLGLVRPACRVTRRLAQWARRGLRHLQGSQLRRGGGRTAGGLGQRRSARHAHVVRARLRPGPQSGPGARAVRGQPGLGPGHAAHRPAAGGRLAHRRHQLCRRTGAALRSGAAHRGAAGRCRRRPQRRGRDGHRRRRRGAGQCGARRDRRAPDALSARPGDAEEPRGLPRRRGPPIMVLRPAPCRPGAP